MGKDKGNALVFSSKRSSSCSTRYCASPGKAEREIERLRAALEVERCRNKQAHRKLSLELRRVREEGRQERERALRELTSRQERQKALELQQQREALGKEHASEVRQLRRWRDRERERECTEATLRQAQELQRLLAKELCGGDCAGSEKPDPQGVRGLLGGQGRGAVYCKLEELLARLHGQASGEQAVLLQGLRQELELEKSRFICHLLEKHGRPSQGGTAPPKEGAPIPAPRRHRSASCAHLLSRPVSRQSQDGPGGAGSSGSRGASPSCARSQSQRAQRSCQQGQGQGPPKKRRSKSARGAVAPLGRPQRCSSPVESLATNSEAGPSTSSSELPLTPDNSTPSRCSEENMEDMVSYTLAHTLL